MTHQASSPQSLSHATPALLPSQATALAEIEAAITSGANPVEVWGLSGTGKSYLAGALQNKPGLFIAHDWLFDRSDAKPGQVAVHFKAGLPEWAGREAPPGSVYQSAMSAEGLLRIWAESQQKRNWAGYLFRNRLESDALARQLAACNIGTVRLLEECARLPHACSIPAAISHWLMGECARARNSDIVGTLKRLLITEGMGPADQAFAAAIIEAAENSLSDDAALRDLCYPCIPGESLCRGIEEIIFAGLPAPEASQLTVAYYLELPPEVREVNEAAFLLRTVRPTTNEENKALCQAVFPVLELIGCRAHEVYHDESKVVLCGEAPRKTGLYIVRRLEKPSRDGRIFIRPESDLTPLIQDSQPSRIRHERLYVRARKAVPSGTVVFGGGDHSLGPDQSALSLGVELALQKLRIPYEVIRGNVCFPPCSFDFDGKRLRSPGSL